VKLCIENLIRIWRNLSESLEGAVSAAMNSKYESWAGYVFDYLLLEMTLYTVFWDWRVLPIRGQSLTNETHPPPSRNAATSVEVCTASRSRNIAWIGRNTLSAKKRHLFADLTVINLCFWLLYLRLASFPAVPPAHLTVVAAACMKGHRLPVP
jgi:hypothetical protein